MVAKIRGFIDLDGGGAGAIDAIDGDDLNDGDVGVVVDTTVDAYLYTLDDDSAAGESLPGIIEPDTNAGDKRWLLANINVNDVKPIGNVQVLDNKYVYFGDDDDFGIYHTGAYGGIDNNTGGLYIDGAPSEDIIFRTGAILIATFASDEVCTFVKHMVTPSSAPTTDYQVANKKYADDNFAAYATASEWTAQQNFNELAITSSSNATAWNLDTAQCAIHTMTENTTISAPSNLNAGGTYLLRVVQAAGLYTLAFNAVFKWGESSTPTSPSASGDVLILSFYSDGTSMYGVEAIREEA